MSDLVFKLTEKDQVRHNGSSVKSFTQEQNWTTNNKPEGIKIGNFSGLTDADIEKFFNAETDSIRYSGFDNAKASGAPVPDNWDDYQSEYIAICTRKVIDPHLKFEKIKKILDVLSLEDTQYMAFHIQEPGMMIPLHTDILIPENRDLITADFEKESEYKRFFIMLTDWAMGHAFHAGNTPITHWKSGDVYILKANETPHASGNFGFLPRIMLTFTGKPTESTFIRFPMLADIMEDDIWPPEESFSQYGIE